MVYTFHEDDSYKDVISLALRGQADKVSQKLLTVLFEMIITEIGEAPFTISLVVEPNLLTIKVVHQGRAIKEDIIEIIDDQVDYLYYQHKTRNSHVLRLKKEVKVKS